MTQRAEHYRGYDIDGNVQGRGWSVEVHPNTPDLPILRRAVFRVMHPAWTEALVQARARIDAMLRYQPRLFACMTSYAEPNS